MQMAEATQQCRTCDDTKRIEEFDLRADTGKRTTQCKDCRRAYQNGRLSRARVPRSRTPRRLGAADAFVCTRCGLIKLAAAFPPRRRGKDELQAWCRSCFAQVGATYYLSNREREIVRVRRNTERGRDAARTLVQAYLASHHCVDCDEDDPLVLEFDHIGPKRKDVSLMVAGGYPCATIQAEIAKCEVRCGNCHRRRTYERRAAHAAVREVKGPWSLLAA